MAQSLKASSRIGKVSEGQFFRDSGRGLRDTFRFLPYLFKRLRDKKAEVGLRYMLRILIFDFVVPSWLFDTKDFILFVWEFDRAPPAEPGKPEIRLATGSDTALLCQFGRSQAEISNRLEEGASASILTREGKLLGYHWVKPGPWFKLSWLAFLPAASKDIFSLDTRVHRSYRGRGLAGQMRHYAAANTQRQGYRRMYCTVDNDNRNSLRAAEKVGYHPIARLWFVRILGLTMILVDGRRRLGYWSARRPLTIPVASFEDAHGA